MDSPANEKLKEILTKVLLVDKSEINDGMSRKNMEDWDSMAHLMLVTEIESAFEITMSDDDITAIQTVGDVKKTLKKLGVII